jgi:hypothetical protein
MSGKRPVSTLAESLPEWERPSGPRHGSRSIAPLQNLGHAVALEKVSAEIEYLKSDLLGYAQKNEVPDPFDDVISSAETEVCNSFKQLLKEELRKIFKVLDTMNVGDALAIYESLDRSIFWAIGAGISNPNPVFGRLRKDVEEAARRAKRKANTAARERREKMRPFVEDVAVDFPQVHEFSRLATAMYKALMKRTEFRNVLPKSLNPRQIKGDIEAILVAIDIEAEQTHDAGFR